MTMTTQNSSLSSKPYVVVTSHTSHTSHQPGGTGIQTVSSKQLAPRVSLNNKPVVMSLGSSTSQILNNILPRPVTATTNISNLSMPTSITDIKHPLPPGPQLTTTTITGRPPHLLAAPTSTTTTGFCQPQPESTMVPNLPTEPVPLTKEDLMKSHTKFVLGPTPAQIKVKSSSPLAISNQDKLENTQESDTRNANSSPLSSQEKMVNLGKKSFFKKAIKEDGMDKVLETVNFEEKFSSLPEYKPLEGASPSLPSLPTSPHLFVQSYRKKRKLSITDDDLGSDASATPRTPRTPQTTTSTPKSCANLTGNTFFGPDFNPEAFKANDQPDATMSSINNTPKTPSTAGGSNSNSSDTKPNTLRRTLDSRRQLVMELFQEQGLFPSNQSTALFQHKHSDIFPNKVCLQLKIREVRQKMMASNSSACSTPTSAGQSLVVGLTNGAGQHEKEGGAAVASVVN